MTRWQQLPGPIVELWRGEHDRIPPATLQHFDGWLSDGERERMLRYRRPQDQRRYLIGRGMLRWLLQRHTGRDASGWRFVLGAYGRPELHPDDAGVVGDVVPHFNLSHSRGVTIAAIARCVDRVGADVETRDRTSQWKLARRYFAPSEAQIVEAAQDQDKGELFLRYWTLKEAYVKAVGQGISLGLDTFAFQLSDQSPPVVTFTRQTVAASEQRPASEHRPCDWHFFELALPCERIALAVESAGRPRLRQHDFAMEAASSAND